MTYYSFWKPRAQARPTQPTELVEGRPSHELDAPSSMNLEARQDAVVIGTAAQLVYARRVSKLTGKYN